jgi:hypothetical protein
MWSEPVTQPSTEASRLSIWPRVVIVLVFAALGPLIGGPIACTGFFTGIGIAAGGVKEAVSIPAALGLCMIYGPVFGFFFGLVPAALTGVLLAILSPRPRRDGLRRAVIASVAVSTAYAIVTFHDRIADPGDGISWPSAAFAGLVIVTGAIAGALCWLMLTAIFERRGDDSPKPSGADAPAS